MTQTTIQIGKNGVSVGTFTSLENAFKTNELIRICVLKSAGHEKSQVLKIAEKIVNKLGKKYTYKIIGFTIFIRKWRKDKR
ncbi:MAG: YhbY family RNA-binding protein [archaeon]